MNILEIPQSVIGFGGKKVGFAGGFYLRFFPKWFIEMIIKSKNKNYQPVFIYLHLREIEPDQESMNLKLSFIENIIHYYGLNHSYSKLDKLVDLNKHTFIRMDHYYNKNGK